MKLKSKKKIELTFEQSKAYDTYSNMLLNGGGSGLLYGVTGSGKTQVYLKLIDKALENDRDVIVLVPEISLTPQVLSIFHARYGDKVAVFHSGLSLVETTNTKEPIGEKRKSLSAQGVQFLLLSIISA